MATVEQVGGVYGVAPDGTPDFNAKFAARLYDRGGAHINVDHPVYAGNIGLALRDARKEGEYGALGGLQGAVVLVPQGVRQQDAPLDLTGAQFNLRGAGSHNTVLRGNTSHSGSGVLLDMTGAGLSSVRELLMDTLGMATPSLVGVLQARSGPHLNADLNTLADLSIRLDSSPTAFSNRGSVAVYNCCSESAVYHRVNLRADTPIYIGSGNEYGIASPRYGTIAADVSMTVVEVSGSSFFQALRGPAVKIGGAKNVDLGNTALAADPPTTTLTQSAGAGAGSITVASTRGFKPNDEIRIVSASQEANPPAEWAWIYSFTGNVVTLQTPLVNAYPVGSSATLRSHPYAIEVLSESTHIRYSGSMEAFPSLLRMRNNVFSGFNIDCYAALDPAGHRILLQDGASLVHSRIHVAPTSVGVTGGTLIRSGHSGNPDVRDSHVTACELWLYDQGLDLPNGSLLGNTIYSTDTLENTKKRINVGRVRAGNIIHASNGVHIDGMSTW